MKTIIEILKIFCQIFYANKYSKEEFLAANLAQKTSIFNNIIEDIVGIIRFETASKEKTFYENFGKVDVELIEGQLNQIFDYPISLADTMYNPEQNAQDIAKAVS